MGSGWDLNLFVWMCASQRWKGKKRYFWKRIVYYSGQCYRCFECYGSLFDVRMKWMSADCDLKKYSLNRILWWGYIWQCKNSSWKGFILSSFKGIYKKKPVGNDYYRSLFFGFWNGLKPFPTGYFNYWIILGLVFGYLDYIWKPTLLCHIYMLMKEMILFHIIFFLFWHSWGHIPSHY